MLAQLEELQKSRIIRQLDQAVRGGHADQALHHAKELAAAEGGMPAELGARALVHLVRSVERVVINA